MNSILNGFSGSFTSIAGVDKVISTIAKYNGNVWRNASNPTWVSGGTRPWNTSYLDYFLSHSNHYLIIDRNHLYPPSAMTDVQWVQAESDIMTLLVTYGSTPANEPTKPQNKRVVIELANECNQTDSGVSGTTASVYNAHIQTIINHIRSAGYTNIIVQNNQWQPWVKYTEPLNKTHQGQHAYMNQLTTGGGPAINFEAKMQGALNAGITSICNTEVGASATEGAYTTGNMGYLSDFLDWCKIHNVGCCIWLNHNIDNLTTYEKVGFTVPWVSTERNKISISGAII